MLSRKNRFHGYNSMRHVYRQGATARGPLFAVKAVQNPSRQSYRLAVVVSRKVSKSAVARNRIRRRLFELARELEDKIVQPYDIVITVFHASLAAANHKDIAAQLKKQFKETGIIN